TTCSSLTATSSVQFLFQRVEPCARSMDVLTQLFLRRAVIWNACQRAQIDQMRLDLWRHGRRCALWFFPSQGSAQLRYGQLFLLGITQPGILVSRVEFCDGFMVTKRQLIPTS